jgi:hypothetical protein
MPAVGLATARPTSPPAAYRPSRVRLHASRVEVREPRPYQFRRLQPGPSLYAGPEHPGLSDGHPGLCFNLKLMIHLNC